MSLDRSGGAGLDRSGGAGLDRSGGAGLDRSGGAGLDRSGGAGLALTPEVAVLRLRTPFEERGLAAAVPLAERVVRAAWKAHDGQKRSSGDPYVVHPIRVAEVVLVEWDRREPDLVFAALLHDAVEDTPFTLDDVQALAGPRVRELVGLLTKADARGYASKAARDTEYFARLRAGPEGASVVKCADRVDNLRDMATASWSLAKKKAYVVEARELILPVARERAPWAAEKLESVCDHVDRELAKSAG